MLTPAFPALPATTIEAINILGQWLARDDFSRPPQADDAELIVLAGNAVIPTIDAACELAAGSELPLLITGGLGHSTTFLYGAIAAHPRYNVLPTTGRAEAAILKDIATTFWKIPADKVITEEKSTNCGENARFAKQVMSEHALAPLRVILVQDPTMQRRTAATFERLWQEEARQPQWRSWPGFKPVLASDERATRFIADEIGLWPVARYISLILGELPRIRNDAQGYGPKGRDFITHVEIPAQVTQAWQLLQNDAALAEWTGDRGL